MFYASAIELYLGYNPNFEEEVQIFDDGDGVQYIGKWGIKGVKEPTKEQLEAIWNNQGLDFEKQRKCDMLKRMYISKVKDTDNDFIMYQKRKELGIDIQSDIDKKDTSLQVYKGLTESYEAKKIEINNAVSIEVLNNIEAII